MDLGPLEYVVIGVKDQIVTHALVEELITINETGKVRVVDLIFVTKVADGTIVVKEVSELCEKEPALYGCIVDDLMGLLTIEDIEHLTEKIPSDTSALVILFEHTWLFGLTEAVRISGDVVFTGGMVSHEALIHVNSELKETREAQNA